MFSMNFIKTMQKLDECSDNDINLKNNPAVKNENEDIYSDIIKRIIIDEKCVACGICSLTTKYIEEGEDGKAKPVEPGLISKLDIVNFEIIIGTCPVNAIKLVNAGMASISGKVGLEELKTIINIKLANYKVPFPEAIDYEFNKSEYSTPTAFASGEYKYEYKSSDKAEREGLREFDRIMYSQSKAIVQRILIEYKNHKLRKYSYYDKEPSNYFYDNNKIIEKKLKEIITEIRILSENKIKLPNEFEKFDIEPDIGISGDSINREIYMFQLRHLEELWFVDRILKERESLSWYQTFIDYDDSEDYKGKDKYCYKNISKVCSKFGQYLLNDTQRCLTGSDGVKKVLESPINNYIEKVEIELKLKANILIKEINNVVKNI